MTTKKKSKDGGCSFAVVTGASSGIGYQLAKRCAENGFDLLVAADDPRINEAANDFRALGAQVDVVETDLATEGGVNELYQAIEGRPVDALLANAGPVWVTPFSTRNLRKRGT
jgi:uncharacterized protein